MAGFLAELVVTLLQIVVDLFCHFTSKFLLPVLTRGRVVVMPVAGPDGGRWFVPCMRLPNGQIGLGGVAVVGALFCLAFVVISFSLRPQIEETRALVKADRLMRTAGEGHQAN